MRLRFLCIWAITVSAPAYWTERAFAQQPRCQNCVAIRTQFSQPQSWSKTFSGSSEFTCQSDCTVTVVCLLTALFPIGSDASPTVCGCVYDVKATTVTCRRVQCQAGQTVKVICSGVLSGTYTVKTDLTCTRPDGTVEAPVSCPQVQNASWGNLHCEVTVQ